MGVSERDAAAAIKAQQESRQKRQTHEDRQEKEVSEDAGSESVHSFDTCGDVNGDHGVDMTASPGQWMSVDVVFQCTESRLYCFAKTSKRRRLLRHRRED